MELSMMPSCARFKALEKVLERTPFQASRSLQQHITPLNEGLSLRSIWERVGTIVNGGIAIRPYLRDYSDRRMGTVGPFQYKEKSRPNKCHVLIPIDTAA